VERTDPSPTWYFAKGATGTFFDTYILLSNPGASPANVTLTYLLDDATTVTEQRTVAPNARVTVSVESSHARLSNASFSTQVVADAPIVAERSMYWGPAGDALPWTEGHNSLGVTAPGPRWLLAEGRIGGPLAHQTYILLGNPSTTSRGGDDYVLAHRRFGGGEAVRRTANQPRQCVRER
jgi:hypothetical protein